MNPALDWDRYCAECTPRVHATQKSVWLVVLLVVLAAAGIYFMMSR